MPVEDQRIEYTADAWEPGLPLYYDSSGPYSRCFYNFRDESAAQLREDDCTCSDRAQWPVPLESRSISDDPLASFISEYHAWRKRLAEQVG